MSKKIGKRELNRLFWTMTKTKQTYPKTKGQSQLMVNVIAFLTYENPELLEAKP